MALIKCKECGKNISDTTKECIHCGAPTKYSINYMKMSFKIFCCIIGVFILLFLLIAIVIFISNLGKKNKHYSDTLNAKYSVPEYPSVYQDPYRRVLSFSEDGRVSYQLCNSQTDACGDSTYYTYTKDKLEVFISNGDNSVFSCTIDEDEKFLDCYSGDGHKTFAKVN